tara:strand:- start:449 stop:1411 length:963 start_codon:yes stop_codon:yes gene_type:complete
MFKNILLSLLSIFTIMGCGPDYSIIGEIGKEYIYIEIPNNELNAEIWVDSFIQPSSVNGVDILWVIDTSGSMINNEPQLLLGIEAMMNSLPTSGWRLNMIPNSPPHVYDEAQFPLVPGDDVVDAQTMYNNMSGGVYEKGFDALKAYIEGNTYAPQWMRYDAALLVVFVSDEEDQSNQTSSEFVEWYKTLREHVYLASVVHLDPADSLCNVSSWDVGYESIDATNQLNGVIVDICSDDWAPGVAEASTQVEPYEQYELTYDPIKIKKMRVFVNGVLNHDWHYDASDNNVYFTVTPAANDLVEIAYLYNPIIIEDIPELPIN